MIDRRRALMGVPTGPKNLMTTQSWIDAAIEAWGTRAVISGTMMSIDLSGLSGILYFPIPHQSGKQYTVVLYGKSTGGVSSLRLRYDPYVTAPQINFAKRNEYSYATDLSDKNKVLIGLFPYYNDRYVSFDLSKCGLYEGDVRYLFKG